MNDMMMQGLKMMVITLETHNLDATLIRQALTAIVRLRDENETLREQLRIVRGREAQYWARMDDMNEVIGELQAELTAKKEEQKPKTRKAIRDAVLDDVWAETVRQDSKWGADRDLSALMWLAILTEEVGEVAQAALQSMTDEPKGLRDAREELVQVAAVAVQFIESLDRTFAAEPKR